MLINLKETINELSGTIVIDNCDNCIFRFDWKCLLLKNPIYTDVTIKKDGCRWRDCPLPVFIRAHVVPHSYSTTATKNLKEYIISIISLAGR